ncbi:hypothetical protein WR25_10428 [Diploscapter pachys]|uniref:IMD domain-containing protein n=1 Tax=Diploscapter pachys TaxID=2018661 RepID=A0A2A2JM69_9BILA|nr:hypothetical protein WR25_10428 [Diploscapter pachys]
MDPDLEFNTLAAVSQSVINDIKNSHPAWETVNQKALKLATSLRSTVQCLTAFVDAVQSVTDYANNLKGATRDIGACMTRVCMRERVLETRLRAMADSLSEQLVTTVQGKTAFWKQRTTDLEKICVKHNKKARNRKTLLDPSTLVEQRDLCAQVLAEQRSQFAFFVSSVASFLVKIHHFENKNDQMPKLFMKNVFFSRKSEFIDFQNAEIATLEEGAHIRQVTESLESTLQHVDGSSLISGIVSDISQGSEGAWKRCLDKANSSFLASEAASSSNYSSSDVSFNVSRATTPACPELNGTPAFKRPSTLSGLQLMQSNGEGTNGLGQLGGVYQIAQIGKPPLQRRSSEKSLTKVSPPSPPMNATGNGTTNGEKCQSQNQSPLQQIHSIHHPSILAARSQGLVQRNGNAVVYPRNSTNGFAGTPMCSYAPSSSTSSSEAPSSAAFIAETIQQIDQLGSDLENYCIATEQQHLMMQLTKNNNASPLQNGQNGETPTFELPNGSARGKEEKRFSHPAPPTSLLLDYATVNVSTFYNSQNAGTIPRPPSVGAQSAPGPLSHHGGSMNSVNTVHMGNGLRFRENGSRPPPPVRRSSQITAATPTAPSVAEARMSMGSSIMGSRQSLNSASLYSQLGSQPDVRYSGQMSSISNIAPSAYSYQPNQNRQSQVNAAANYKI